MTDRFTPAERSAVMRKVPGRNSSAELKLRRLLTRMGLRYRLHRKDLPGSPDVVFAGRKLAIFVHGCFWHRHAGCKAAGTPRTRRAFWEEKFARNVTRDAAKAEALTALGWGLLVLWECELRDQGALATRLRDYLGPPGRGGGLR